ncbi:MAG: tripartite tricarboxylate transporter substrate binding protein [Thermodesulfobacteriota bacterium]|nr:tripartite tricarboxylate transporter substrate binding protein [Thermodesulfobacteriota bacterium]
MRKNRIQAVLVFLAATFFIMTAAALAIEKPKDYPTRSIEVVVGYGAGGGSDVFARAIVPEARKLMKVPLVVVNKPGAGGVVALEYVQGQPADGYTIWAGSTTVLLTGGLTGMTKYQYTDFSPIIRAQHDVMLLVVPYGSRFKNIQDVITDAKTRPGEQTWGIVGTAQGYQAYIADSFAGVVGITPKLVPFDTAGRQLAALLGGHVDAVQDEPATIIDLAEAKKARPLLSFSKDRIRPFPTLPTIGEMGAKDFPGIYRGIMVKKGVPPEIVRYLAEVFTAAYNSPAYQKYEAESFLDLRKGFMGPEEFEAFFKEDAEKVTKFLKRTGVYQIRK